MVYLERLERRPCTTQLPQDRLSTNTHFAFIKHAMAFNPTADGMRGPYLWGGDAERQRLELQNNADPSWGDGHYNTVARLKDLGLDPKVCVEVGAGWDASLPINILTVFPHTELVIGELDPEKIKGAGDTLQIRGFDKGRIRFLTGNIAQTFPREGKIADLVDVQNTLQHLIDPGENNVNIPLTWDEAKKGPYPTFDRVVDPIINVAKPGATLLVGEMDFSTWRTYPASGFENDSEALKMTETSVTYTNTATKLGWDVRGAHAWRSREQMEERIERAGKGRLVLDRRMDLAMAINGVGPEDPFTAVIGYIPLALINAINGSINEHREALSWVEGERRAKIEEKIGRLEGAHQLLLKLGKEYIDCLCSPKMRSDLPTMHWMAFTVK